MAGTEAFERFWRAYPRRVAKGEARKAWKKLAPSDALVDQILAALEWQREQDTWTKDDGQFVPHAATWLRGERWEDEPVVPVRRQRAWGAVHAMDWADECREQHGGKCESRYQHGLAMAKVS